MFAKIVRLAAVVGIASIVLTACTPPMPPEVKAALLEQTYTCIDGNANVLSTEIMADAIPSLQGAMSGNCPTMTLTGVESGTPADIAVGSYAPAAGDCAVSSSVPYALDGAVVTATLSQAAGLALSPTTVAGIFDGSIKNWDDAAITKDNAGTAVGSGPIQVVPVTDKLALASFAGWYKQLTGKVFSASLLKPKSQLAVADLGTLADGSIALLPYSIFSVYSVSAMTIPLPAAIVDDPKGNPTGVLPDLAGIQSAGTQLEFTKTGTNVSVKLNYALKPTAPQGSDVAPAPYQAIYPVALDLCGKPSKTVRAVSRYLLRQDAQGILTSLVPLPELLRAESLDVVSVGLPNPKVTAPAN
jgi:phosphate transport system substrate-binding protein